MAVITEIEYSEKKYDCILADPPWSYDNENTGGSKKRHQKMVSGASNKYKTMLIKDIASIPIWKLSKEDSCLFMWAVTPLLPEAFHVMKNWGYGYKTAIYWYKERRLGMGFWFRGDVELCLVGIKGKVKPFGQQVSSFISVPPREHSRKPDELYAMIEAIGFKDKIEMFARERRQGWDVFGNEVPKSTQMLIG